MFLLMAERHQNKTNTVGINYNDDRITGKKYHIQKQVLLACNVVTKIKTKDVSLHFAKNSVTAAEKMDSTVFFSSTDSRLNSPLCNCAVRHILFKQEL